MKKILKIKSGTRITKLGKCNFAILPNDVYGFRVLDNRTIFSSPRTREIEKFYDQYRDAGYNVVWIKKPK